MRGVGRLVETGRPFDMTYIAARHHAGQALHHLSYRDYWNPLAVLEPGADFTSISR